MHTEAGGNGNCLVVDCMCVDSQWTLVDKQMWAGTGLVDWIVFCYDAIRCRLDHYDCDGLKMCCADRLWTALPEPDPWWWRWFPMVCFPLNKIFLSFDSHLYLTGKYDCSTRQRLPLHNSFFIFQIQNRTYFKHKCSLVFGKLVVKKLILNFFNGFQ